MKRVGVPWLALGLLVSLLGASGCSTMARKQKQATYAPTESIIEVVGLLRRHVPDDTYRFPPAIDFSGRNVYRASLLRLENLERLHAGTLRAGHLDGTVAFSKARALERLRGYELAAEHYRVAAEVSETLRQEAQTGESACGRLAIAVRVGLQLEDPLAAGALLPLDAERIVAELDERTALLTDMLHDVRNSHYEWIVREEIERADATRAAYFVAVRHVLADGNIRAVAERQRVASRHVPSKNRLNHMIAIADLFSTLAHEYVAARPPESLGFDPPTFRELVDGATHLYERVASEDGTPEKLEAARRLEAFLAFTLQVDSERFTP